MPSDLSAARERVMAEVKNWRKRQKYWESTRLDPDARPGELTYAGRSLDDAIQSVGACAPQIEVLLTAGPMTEEEADNLRAQVAALTEALQPFIDPAIVCVCREAYTERSLRDPECWYHDWANEIEAGRAALSACKESKHGPT